VPVGGRSGDEINLAGVAERKNQVRKNYIFLSSFGVSEGSQLMPAPVVHM
jgi:hypothetical protein